MNCANNSYVVSIFEKKNVFSFFKKAFLFGSVLTNKYPNDIDILLIYQDFSEDIFMERQKICLALNPTPYIPIDFTLLSSKEISEENFLNNGSQFLAIYP